jgi:alanyl-tRNA synthetase
VTITDRLYYRDPYLRRFEARVDSVESNRVYLDRTAFYPTSGGQPFDRGTLNGSRVVEVIDEGDRIAHVIDGAPPDGAVTGEIDWSRRFDHMQQHSGQHLLSAVLVELFDIPTVSFHLGEEASTIDIAAPALDPERLARSEERANEIVFENRPISISFEHSSQVRDLRKPSDREGELRIITIADLDRSACGGTHVRSTGEIGPVLIRKTDKIRGNVRIEFLCGMRAVRRARADFEALSRIGRALASSLDAAPELVESQIGRIRQLEKANDKLAIEVAAFQGRELYNSTAPDVSGFRRAVVQEAITDELRTRAQAFTAQAGAIFIAWCENPPSVLLAVSKDSGINAGERIKTAVTAHGGRGGGSALMAQGSVPTAEALERIKALL